MGYVLITPVKDEIANLENMKSTVVGQTLTPALWVVVDSGSADGSCEIAKSLLAKVDWAYVIQQRYFPEKGYGHKNFAQAINEGYEYASRICNEKCVQFGYVGKVDADIILSNDYFELLHGEMEVDPRLAITCGRKLIRNVIFAESTPLPDRLMGFNDIRLYRRDFFELMHGYPLTLAPDTVLLVRAISMGWRTKVMFASSFREARLSGAKEGVWKGHQLKGRALYQLGYHPFLVLLNALYQCISFPPHYHGLAIVQGYFSAFVRGEETMDAEIVQYFRKKRLEEVLLFLKRRVRGRAPE